MKRLIVKSKLTLVHAGIGRYQNKFIDYMLGSKIDELLTQKIIFNLSIISGEFVFKERSYKAILVYIIVT